MKSTKQKKMYKLFYESTTKRETKNPLFCTSVKHLKNV